MSEDEEYEYEMEIMTDDDKKLITLTCVSSKLLTPDEFAEALRAYADRIDTLLSMRDLSSNTIN